MKQLGRASRASYLLVLSLAISGCSTDTPSTTPVGGQLVTRLFREHRRIKDTTYQRTYAFFYDQSNPAISLRTGSTTLNGVNLPYDVTMHNPQYHLDSILPQNTSYTWHVVGANNGVSSLDLAVLTPDTLSIANKFTGDTVSIGSGSVAITWAPVVAGGKVGIELDQNDTLLNTYTVTDNGSTSVDISTTKKGKIAIYVFRSNEANSTVLGKLYDMSAECDAFVTLVTVP